MRYSVIIPIYNAEKTLGRCLNSIASQVRDDIEILLIDDGSTDESFQICQTYAQKYPQFRPLHQENEGVSSARNRGLDMACGEYILFADSDDYVSPNYFSVLDQALAGNPDLLLFGYQNFGAVNTAWNLGIYTVSDPVEIAKKADYAMRAYLFSSLWSKAFRRDLIAENDIRFSQNLSIGEDQAFIFSFALHVKKMKSILNTLYHVSVENMDSLSRKRRDYLPEQLLNMNRQMRRSLSGAAVPMSVRKRYEGALAWVFYRSAYSCAKELQKYDYTPVERLAKLKEICDCFNHEGVFPRDLKCAMISLPIRRRMVRVLDAVTLWHR